MPARSSASTCTPNVKKASRFSCSRNFKSVKLRALHVSLLRSGVTGHGQFHNLSPEEIDLADAEERESLLERGVARMQKSLGRRHKELAKQRERKMQLTSRVGS
jgi:hypothetical protein